MAGDDECARVFEAEARLHEIEAAGDGERGRGQNGGIDLVPEVLAQNAGHIDGRGLKEDAAAAAALDPVDEGRGRSLRSGTAAPRAVPARGGRAESLPAGRPE